MNHLGKLIDVVRTGSLKRTDVGGVREDASSLITVVLGDAFLHDFVKAYEGSLDAADRLQAALLPGWDWQRQGLAIIVSTDPGRWEDSQYGFGRNAKPARAWLLAILQGLKHLQAEAGR